MITGLDIASSSPSAYNLPEVPFSLSSKSECTNWGAYLSQHVKTKCPLTDREHTTFLNFWLEHFIFCSPSLAPTKNYVSLAYELDNGATVGLGKLFLREVYRYLHLMSSSLLSQKRFKIGGPWWFIFCGLTFLKSGSARVDGCSSAIVHVSSLFLFLLFSFFVFFFCMIGRFHVSSPFSV
jgi:hypothetical protein